jgi:hypothetical protein
MERKDMIKKIISIIVLMLSSYSLHAEEEEPTKNNSCILNLGTFCVSSGIGLMSNKDIDGKFGGDTNFRIIGVVYSPKLKEAAGKWGTHVMLSPSEDFIDAMGVGLSRSWFEYEPGEYIVTHLGGYYKLNGTGDGSGGVHFIISW